ncbi:MULTISPECIES: hypothetical protein [Nocardia]|nr:MULTISPECIES: hypothetical protein [Nocardia]
MMVRGREIEVGELRPGEQITDTTILGGRVTVAAFTQNSTAT